MLAKHPSLPARRWRLPNELSARVRVGWAFFLSALILLLSSCASVRSVADAKATLWQVRGEHNTLYLLGSIHVLPKQAYPLKPVVERAFDNANAVAFEVNLNRITAKSLQRDFGAAALYPAGESLSENLRPETVLLLDQILPVYGLSLKQVERFRPWYLAETLSSRALHMAGFSEQLGVDIYFYRKAQIARKPVLGLETVRDHAQIFDRMNNLNQKAFHLR